MPRRARGPRLYLDPKRRAWVIRDGLRFVRTGCGESDRGLAEKILADYLGRKHTPQPSSSPWIADMLAAYGKEHVPHLRSAKNTAYTIGSLASWWQGKRISDITARNCRAYAEGRSPTAARRDLETLRAAIGYWHREYGPLPSLPAVVMPAKAEPRDRWLTRSEAAKLVWAARRTPHLARFILLGLYTGTRSGALLTLTWDRIDLDRGVMRRRGHGEAEDSRKRTPPVRLGRRILSHLRRWHRLDSARCRYVIHYEGKAVKKLRRSWAGAAKRAGLNGASPHTLRHTRATWLMQAGVAPWEAAGSLGMSLEMLTRTYGHHHPDWQKRTAEV